MIEYAAARDCDLYQIGGLIDSKGSNSIFLILLEKKPTEFCVLTYRIRTGCSAGLTIT